MNVEVEVNQFIHSEVEKLNKLFAEGAKMAGKDVTTFVTEDYTYLNESVSYFGTFAVPYFLTYSIRKDVEYRILNPYPGIIWYWKNDASKHSSENFLPTQTKLMYDTLTVYMSLLKSENHLQALIIFRSYIEYSSLFYASLLDYEFFQKYTGTETLEEEYKQLWFTALKPAKVLAKIKAMHSEINQLLKEKKIRYGDDAVYRSHFHPFDSKLRGFLYASLSGLAHGSYPALQKNDDVKLYALIWLCTSYLVESQTVINEITSVYFNPSPKELLSKWITIELYLKSMEPNTQLVATKSEY